MTKEITQCRVCESKELSPVLSLGSLEVINLGDKEPLEARLELVFCKGCKLVQLKHTVDPEYLFRNYYYKSGVNRTMRNELADIVRGAMERVPLKKGDAVIDIGANDGTLLSFYPSDITTVGFEPARNLFEESEKKVSLLIGEPFSAGRFLGHIGRKAKVVTAIAMFYDLDDPKAFLRDVKEVLADDGLLIIQQNYLPRMLELNAFDNIVHEHLEYYSVLSLQALLNLVDGLYIEDVEFNDINGGSFRVYVRKLSERMVKEAPMTQAALLAGNREYELHLDMEQPYKEFAVKVSIIRRKVRSFVERLARDGKSVYIAGASTRGNTLVQFCGLGDFFEYATERNPAKFNTTYCGKKVISEETAEELPPDYYLVLPWHFRGELIDRLMGSLVHGTKLIFPLPKPHVVEARLI